MRVSNLRKRLGDVKKTLPDPLSPIPSPILDAPSPAESAVDETVDNVEPVDMELSSSDGEGLSAGCLPLSQLSAPWTLVLWTLLCGGVTTALRISTPFESLGRPHCPQWDFTVFST